jgi:WhiB family redox-sensing transcriptional regulator
MLLKHSWKGFSVTDTLECLVSPRWMASANCRSADPDLFYPAETGKWNKFTVKSAVQVCSRCPVIADCLQWALEKEDAYGILGGTTPEQRSHMTLGRAA